MALFPLLDQQSAAKRDHLGSKINHLSARLDKAVDEAIDMKLKLTSLMEKELLLENLIKAKGYEDAVVTIGSSSGNINVLVKDAEFEQDDAIAIYTILMDEADASPDKVKIIPVS